MNALQELERSLELLVREILREPRSRPFAIRPERLAAGPLASALRFSRELEEARSPGGPSLRAAELELLAVHQVELAWLLREAARVRVAAPGSRVDAWRLALREGLECAAADGLRIARAVFDVLRRTMREDVAAWPSASELARASLALQRCEESELCLAQALLAEDRAAEASALLARSLAREPAPRGVAKMLELASLAEEACGASSRAGKLRSLAARSREVAA